MRKLVWFMPLFFPLWLWGQTGEEGETAPPESTFQSGEAQEEVVEAEAQLRIDDAEKPLSILAVPARAVMDSFLTTSNRRLMLEFFLPSESLVVRASRLPQPYLRKPPVDVTITPEVVLELPHLKKSSRYKRWRVEVYDALGNPVKTFEGNGHPPAKIIWDGITEGGTPIIPGEAYSVMVIRITERGKERTTPVGIVKVPAILTRVPTGEVVAIWDSRVVFQEKTAVPLPRAFRGPLQEMVNVLLTHTKENARIYVYADPEYLGVDQANYLLNFFREQIPFSTAAWKVEVRFFQPGEFRVPRIEIWAR